MGSNPTPSAKKNPLSVLEADKGFFNQGKAFAGGFVVRMSQNKKRNLRKVLYWVAVAVAGSVFLAAAFMVGKNLYEAKKSADQFEELENLVEEAPIEQENAAPVEQTPAQKYGALYEQNQDFVGWISVADTRINYPVMQTVEIPNYYLRRGFDKNYNYYGVPYVAEHCKLETSDNVVIYGHHMDNGSMFSDLNKYLTPSFYPDHSLIQFDTLTEFGTYQVISVFTISALETFAYHLFADAADEAEFNAFIAECKSRSRYDTGVTATYGDRLITLSTCEYSQANGRLVVVAKKIA